MDQVGQVGYQSIQHPLTPVKESLLVTEPNSAIMPRYLSKESYIIAVEEACTRLLPREAEEFRAELSYLLRKYCPLP